ncbi:MAG: glutamine--fructose-6-phosphate transaminase (isomerizing) [Deltaproteobacteria bacterium]|nr:glutamine--fructose-6-phosphate transaminase (isomerizing) [Deltaproteobacteria bacterium]
MCGIIGYIGNREAVKVLIDGLKRLEYRGYDSAGVAVLNNGKIQIERAEGKLTCLEAKLKKFKSRAGFACPRSKLAEFAEFKLSGNIGIGHTRWATHGVPSERNAHPHRVGDVVVVHNGIIENYSELRKKLIQKGFRFLSETDTEVFCHLINEELKKQFDIQQAIRNALTKVRGSYALVVLHGQDPEHLYVARQSSPLVIGLGKGENFVASDVAAILPYTRDVIFLEEGELVTLSREPIRRASQKITWDPLTAEKGGFKHFMLKEIFEQPRVVNDTLMGRIQPDSGVLTLEGIPKLFGRCGFPFQKVEIVACGTSYHAGLVGKYWLESMARVPVNVSLASEFRYATPVIDSKTLVIPISQSGETADTLAATTQAKKEKGNILAICNVLGSSLARLAHTTLYTHAGPEIGVASTKAFVSQLTVLYLLALEIAKRRGELDTNEVRKKMAELCKIPQHLESILKGAKIIKKVAKNCIRASHFLFIARGSNYPLALEGALKLKEISYVHAEGFAAGELKHGPIALVEKKIPVVALIPKGETYEKILSNVEEVKARGAFVIAICEAGDKHVSEAVDVIIPIPKTDPTQTPLLYTIPLQLFAYTIANEKGCDVDQPRNLAKSVTVE